MIAWLRAAAVAVLVAQTVAQDEDAKCCMKQALTITMEWLLT
jgi:hypothetical protein